MAGLDEKGRVTGPALAEVKVPADNDGPDAQPLDENICDELVCSQGCERGVESRTTAPSRPRRSKTPIFTGAEVKRNTTDRPAK